MWVCGCAGVRVGVGRRGVGWVLAGGDQERVVHLHEHQAGKRKGTQPSACQGSPCAPQGTQAQSDPVVWTHKELAPQSLCGLHCFFVVSLLPPLVLLPPLLGFSSAGFSWREVPLTTSRQQRQQSKPRGLIPACVCFYLLEGGCVGSF